MKDINLFSGYISLVIAVIAGIISNSFLKTTHGFAKITPTFFCLSFIFLALYFLSRAMTIIPIGFSYASYGAMTIIGVALFGIFKYNQTPNLYGIIGLVLIISGVIILNIFGKVK